MRLENFAQATQELLQDAQTIQQQYNHAQLDVEHMFLALLRHGEPTERLLQHLDVDPARLVGPLEQELAKLPKVYGQHSSISHQVYITPRTQRLFKRAEEQATRHNQRYVAVEHLWLALCHEQEQGVARIMREAGLSAEQLNAAIEQLRPTASAPYETVAAQVPARPSLEERVAALEVELATIRAAQRGEQPELAALQAALVQSQAQIAALEQRNRQLRALLQDVQAQLAQAQDLIKREVGVDDGQ